MNDMQAESVDYDDGSGLLCTTRHILACLEQPEEVQRHLRSLQDILHRAENEFQPRLTALNDGETVTDWMGLWRPGRHHRLQCGLSVMVSPDMFEQFALPELDPAGSLLYFRLVLKYIMPPQSA